MPSRTGHGVDRLLQLREDRQSQGCASLLLTDVQPTGADMLRPHAHDVAASLCGIEQQLDRKPGTCAELMMGTERCDLFVAPRAIPFALPWDFGFNASGRVVGEHVDRHRKPHEMAYCVQPIAP